MARRSWTWNFPLTEIQVALNDVLQEISDLGGAGAVSGFPETEIRATASGYQVVAALPGMKRDEIDVAVAGQRVTLRGTRRRPHVEDGRPIRLERFYGTFEKSIQVADDADPGRIRARLADGLLTIDVPFRAEDPSQRIDIDVEGV